MAYRLLPQVAGELGAETLLDSSTHPPTVHRLDYVLDVPDADDLIQAFPVFLVSTDLGERMESARLTGFALDAASVRASANYRDVYGEAPHRQYLWMKVERTSPGADLWLDSEYQLCVTDRAFNILEHAKLTGCLVARLPD